MSFFKGGTPPSDGMDKNQEKVSSLMQHVDLETRNKLLHFYDRDFKLFNYTYIPATNAIK